MKTILQLQDLIEQTRCKNTETYEHWCQIGRKLALLRDDPKGHAYEHLDANLDLLLRDLENEQKDVIASHGEYVGGGVLFLQISLSKMWVFSIYEILRATCAASSCENSTIKTHYCKNDDCFRCKVLTAKQEISPFRVSLGKLEPEKKQPQVAERNYHAQPLVNEETGSIGWRAKSLKSDEPMKINDRLQLSNFVLNTLTAK